MNTKLIIIFLSISLSNSVYGQSKQETLKILEKKATLYLNQMYSEQKFDLAYKNWDDSVFSSIEEIYKEKNEIINDRTSLINKIQNEYQRFYKTNKHFTFIKFKVKDIFNQNDHKIAAFEYTYKEEVNGKYQNSERFLYFKWSKKELKWYIIDYRITEVLIDNPNRWLY